MSNNNSNEAPVPLPDRRPGLAISVFPDKDGGFIWHTAFGTKRRWVGGSGNRETLEEAYSAAIAAGNRYLSTNQTKSNL